MGLKRITARIEVTYPADAEATLAELAAATPGFLGYGLGPENGELASFQLLNTGVDPDPEPTLPDAADETGAWKS